MLILSMNVRILASYALISQILVKICNNSEIKRSKEQFIIKERLNSILGFGLRFLT